MTSFLSLPMEIRFQIYRELRSFNSPTIKSPIRDESNGYCSFGFHSRILETNSQISSEAKEVFYGENYWTFFASQRNDFSSILFRMEPMVLTLPFIRKAHIRFAMTPWLFRVSSGGSRAGDGEKIQRNVREICQVLLRAPTLRTLKIIWTETSTTSFFPKWGKISIAPVVRDRIFEALQPLIALPTTIELRKSLIMVLYRNGIHVEGMEIAFSECVDEVVTLRHSTQVF